RQGPGKRSLDRRHLAKGPERPRVPGAGICDIALIFNRGNDTGTIRCSLPFSSCCNYLIAKIGTSMRSLMGFLIVAAAAFQLAGCGDSAKLPEQASTGANPTIPAPVKSYIPTVKIARATGWPADGRPTALSNLNVNSFAKDLDHPRWLFV